MDTLGIRYNNQTQMYDNIDTGYQQIDESVGIDNRYYSPSLYGKEQVLSDALSKQGSKVYSGQLTQLEQDNFVKLKNTMSALSEKGLVPSKFVLSETSPKYNAYLDGDTIVIGKDMLESDQWQKALTHELTHFAENSPEYAKMAKFIIDNNNIEADSIDKLFKKYQINDIEVDEFLTELTNGTLYKRIADGTASQEQITLLNEVVSDKMSDILGNEEMIARLVRKEESLARKIYNRIKDYIKVLMVKTPEEKQLIKKLHTSAKMFEKALRSANAGYISNLDNNASDTEEKDANVQYSLKDANIYMSRDGKTINIKENTQVQSNEAVDVLSKLDKKSFTDNGQQYNLAVDLNSVDKEYIESEIKHLFSTYKTVREFNLDRIAEFLSSRVHLVHKIDSKDRTRLNKINRLLDKVKKNIRYTEDMSTASKKVLVKYTNENGRISLDNLVGKLNELGANITSVSKAEQLSDIAQLHKELEKNSTGKLATTILDTKGMQSLQKRIKSILINNISGLSHIAVKGDAESEKRALKEQYEKDIKNIKAEEKENTLRIYYTNRLAVSMELLKEEINNAHLKKALDASEFKDVILKFAKIIYSKNVMHKSKTVSDALTTFLAFYEKNYKDSEFYKEHISSEVARLLEKYNGMNVPIDSYDIQSLEKIADHIYYLYKFNRQVVVNGQHYDAREYSSEILKDIKNGAGNYNQGNGKRLMNIMKYSCDPRTMFLAISGSVNGGGKLMSAFNELVRGETNARYLDSYFMSEVETFLSKHKEYRKSLFNKMLTVADKQISLGDAMYIYTLAKVKQGRDSLKKNGIAGKCGNEFVKIDRLSDKDIDDIEKNFSETDKELISVYESVMKKCTEKKIEFDKMLSGYTLIDEDSYYMSIIRDESSITQDYSTMREWSDSFDAMNPGFNQHRNKAARNRIALVNLHDVVKFHAKGMGKYCGLSQAMRNFTLIMNSRIAVDMEGNIVSYDSPTVSTNISLSQYISDNVDRGFNDYIKKLFKDINSGTKDGESKAVQKLKNNFVTAILGFNFKSYASQLAGFPMATIYINPKNLAKALASKAWMSEEDVEQYHKYSELATVREVNDSVARAAGVEGYLNKVGQIATKPIQTMDNYMVRRIFLASKYQIEDQLNRKVETDTDYNLVTDLFEKVVRETQSNDSIIEKSLMQRHNSETMKMFSLFMSDAVKQISSIMQNIVLWQNAKRAGESKYVSLAKRRFARSVTAVLTSNLMYVGIGMLFALLLDKKDEEGNSVITVEEFIKQYASSLFGMFPMVRDAVDYFIDGYDIENVSTSVVMDLLSSLKDCSSVLWDYITGKAVAEHTVAITIRKLIVSVSTMLGIPINNIEKYTVGVIGWFDKGLKYQWESMFYGSKSNYVKKIAKEGDISYSEVVLDTYIKQCVQGELSDKAKEYIIEFLKDDKLKYKLPTTMKNVIVYNKDEETGKQMSKEEYEKFLDIYSQAVDVVNSIVVSANFKKMSKKAQSDAVQDVFEYYYKLAKTEVLNDSSLSISKMILSKSIGVSNAMTILAEFNDINGAKNRRQYVDEIVRKYGLSYEQRQILLISLGYKPTSIPTAIRAIKKCKLPQYVERELIDKFKK